MRPKHYWQVPKRALNTDFILLEDIMSTTFGTTLLTISAIFIAACGNNTNDSTESSNGANAGTDRTSTDAANPSGTGGKKSSTTSSSAANSEGGASSEPRQSVQGGSGATEAAGSEGGAADTEETSSSDPDPSTGGSSSKSSGNSSGGSGGADSSSVKATGGTSSSGSGKATGGSSSSRSSGGTSAGSTTKAVGGSSAASATTTTSANTGLEHFSFFVTSYAAMVKLSGSNLGFGGKLDYDGSTGIDGADKICAAIAELSMQGASTKDWKAFLSTSTVNAIDRITYEGPFYDRRGRQVASSKAGLLATRPTGADSAIINDLPNENGTPNHAADGTAVDNHDVLTGTSTQGKATGFLCNDWKDNSQSGQIQIGHSWPAHGDSWIMTHTVSGCKPGVTFLNNANAESGSQGTVGSMGGYGAIYCLASQP